ncbi:hypothetical protein [Pseudomonas sp. S2_F03]
MMAELEEAHGQARLHLRATDQQPHFFGLDAAALTLVRNIARRVGRAPGEVFVEVCLTPQQAAGQWLRSVGIDVHEGPHLCLTIALGQPRRTAAGGQSVLASKHAQALANRRRAHHPQRQPGHGAALADGR